MQAAIIRIYCCVRKRREEASISPEFVPPMLAKRVQVVTVGKQWEYEVKFDGYRIEALKHASAMRLLSRRRRWHRDLRPFAVSNVRAFTSRHVCFRPAAVPTDLKMTWNATQPLTPGRSLRYRPMVALPLHCNLSLESRQNVVKGGGSAAN